MSDFNVSIDKDNLHSALRTFFYKTGAYESGKHVLRSATGRDYDNQLKQLQIKQLKNELGGYDSDKQTIDNVFAANMTRGLAEEAKSSLGFLDNVKKPGSLSNAFSRAFKIKF